MHEMQKTEQIDKKIKFPFKSWLLPFLFALQRSLAVMANSGRCTRVHMHTHKRTCMALVLHYPNIRPPWKTLPGFVGVAWLGLNLLLSLNHTHRQLVSWRQLCVHLHAESMHKCTQQVHTGYKDRANAYKLLINMDTHGFHSKHKSTRNGINEPPDSVCSPVNKQTCVCA